MVASVSVLSAAAFVWMRAATPLPYPQFQGLCERLLSAGLSLKPGDTFCDPAPWTSHAAIVAAMLLVAAGFVLACGILAATGRRGTALLPFLAAPAVSFSGILLSDHWWDAHVWPHGTVATGVTTLALMSAPVVAVAVSVRGPRVVRAQPSLVAGVVSGLAVAGAVVAIAYVARGMLAHHFGSLVSGFSIGSVVPGAIAMAIFGSLLGPDRRWWPWSLVPTAILLSMAPSVALLVGRERLVDWSQFGIVLPLFLIGLVSSMWRPVALRLTRGHRRGSGRTADRAARDRHGPDTPATGPAGGGSQRDRRGSARGVARDLPRRSAARSAELIDPDVSRCADRRRGPPYQARPPPSDARDGRVSGDPRDVPRVRRLEGGRRRSVHPLDPRVADAGWDRKPGPRSGDRVRDRHGGATRRRLREHERILPPAFGRRALVRTSVAVRWFRLPPRTWSRRRSPACGSTPWSAAAVRRFPVATMCDGLERSGGYLICRASQAFMTTSMQPA